MWAPLVSIHPLTDDLEVPPYIIELMKDNPLHPSAYTEAPTKDARRVDTTRLALQISHMLSQLRQRITPSQLGLGEETSSCHHPARTFGPALEPVRIAASLPALCHRGHCTGCRRFRSHAFLRDRQGIHPAGHGCHLFTGRVR
jgi:hypothetical protein